MPLISDSLAPLRKLPYKLCCNCQRCISYSYEDISTGIVVEPFMNAVNIVFNILTESHFKVESTSVAQNSDGSSTTTWVWIKQVDQNHSWSSRQLKLNENF